MTIKQMMEQESNESLKKFCLRFRKRVEPLDLVVASIDPITGKYYHFEEV